MWSVAGSDRKVGVQAHRGYSGRYPENTLRAFAEAIKVGADQIETDIRVSKDGTVCLLHDAAVDRTTNGHGPISEMTIDEVKALDAGGWCDPSFSGETIPTLAEALDFVAGKARLNIEIKMNEQPPEVWRKALESAVAAVTSRDMQDSVLFSSFHAAPLQWVRRLAPEMAVALLDWDREQQTDKQELVMEMGGKGWFPHTAMVTPERVEQAHKRDLLVICGGGNNAETRERQVRFLAAAGVDFISTNYPLEVIDCLKTEA